MDLKPISLKVPVDVLERIDAEATEAGLSRTALLLRPFVIDPVKAASLEALMTLPCPLQDLGHHGPKARDRNISPKSLPATIRGFALDGSPLTTTSDRLKVKKP